MGGETSRPPPPPPPKKPRVRKEVRQVYDYLPNSSRDRPKSVHSWTDVQYVTKLGQQGRSTSEYDVFSSQAKINQTTPKWQSKWEIDMRPDPAATDDKSILRPWKSMPLPTTDNVSTMNKVTAGHRPTGRRSKKGKSRNHRASLSKALTPLPDVEEADQFDRMSVSSLQVDGFKMIYKTDARAENLINQTAKLWQWEPRKANKQWFLGSDSHLQETVPSVPKKRNTTIFVKQVNPVPAKTRSNTKPQPITEEF